MDDRDLLKAFMNVNKAVGEELEAKTTP